MRHKSLHTPHDRHKQRDPIATDFNHYVANFVDKYAQTTEKDEWMDEVISYLNEPLPTSVPNAQANNQFVTSRETPMGYGFQMLDQQGTWGVNPNPMVSNGAMPVMSSMFNNSGSSVNVGHPTGYNSASVNAFNPRCFGESSIKNVGSTNVFNNGIPATEAFDGRSRTVTPGGLLHSVAHSPAQNFDQQKPFYHNLYNVGFPVSSNDVQPNFQNIPEGTHILGTTYNTQTSNGGTFLQPQIYMPGPPQPGQWVQQFPVRDQSNGFKTPRLISWESVQGRPLVAEASSSHNCNGLNCNICGQVTTFDMASRKRKLHFEHPNNESWVGSSTDLMESKKERFYLEPPSDYESWVGSGTLMDVLTYYNLPFDLPPLEQWPNSSEDDSCPDANNRIAEDAMRNRPDGNEESSQLGPNAPCGTLMDVYSSFIKSSASTTDALGPKVNKVAELSCEEKVLCGFNAALDDYEAVMESMEPIVLEAEKISAHTTPVDDNEPEVEVTNTKNPGAALADNVEGKRSGLGSLDIKTPSASLADTYEDNRSGSGSRDIKKQSASFADSLTASQIKEHLSSFIQPKKDISGNTTPSVSQKPCQLCSNYKLLLAPTPVYCSSCDLRIKHNVKYYWSKDENTKTQHCICMGCYKGCRASTIKTRGGSVVKASLHLAKNDEEVEDSWVQCDTCQHWQHRICGLYNNETDLEGKAEYVCPKCCLKEIENGTRISLPETAGGAKDLPRTNLSDHIEQRLLTRLQQEREQFAKFHGTELEKVPVAEDLVVRVVVSVDKELEVKKQFREIFHGQDYPEKVEYRSKLILLFQKIGGVDVCLFGMYVQEFGSDCIGPNKRCVYISYIDSVKYFRPDRKTASGEPLRTFVYHEILIGYLEHCKKRGFASCYIWSCPLIKGEDYIFYCHPKTQKTPEKTKLRQWYKLMIKKAVEDGIVIDQTNLFNEFFIPSMNKKISAARLPCFDGDFWSDIAVNVSKKLDEEESSGGSSCTKPRTKRILIANGQEMPTKDALVMHKLGDIILPDKENYMILRLQHMCTSCKEAILSGSRWFCNHCNKIQLCSRCFSEGRMNECGSCKDTKLSEDVLSSVPVDTKDNDDALVNNFFQTRDDFLNKCQNSLYQFNTLGHAKYSSMMVLHHFRHNLVVQPKGDTCNTRKLIPPSTEVASEPRKEQPQNQKTETLNRALDALLHASRCKSVDGCYPDCRTVKMLLQHVSVCTRGRCNGCEICRGAWWILDNHTNICTEPNCTIPHCMDIRKKRANSCQRLALCKVTN